MTIHIPQATRELPQLDPISFIDEAGRPTPNALHGTFARPSDTVLLGLYRRMILARRFEEQVTTLTRQGRLATYPAAIGQEACEIGATTALRPGDWLFPTYRDSAAVLTRGVEPAQILESFRGDWHSGYDPHEHHVAPQTTPLATQTLHATGFAMAARLRHEDMCTLTFLGDGASSEGDTHEALNVASVWQTPTVFFVQNNQYAISVPLAEQSHAAMLADRAVGYGMPGFRVDGNDVAAVFAVVSHALDHARNGHGPTLVEGLTYRVGPHTNSDDPSRYRGEEEVEAWRKKDPITRLGTYLRTSGALEPEREEKYLAEAEDLAASVRTAMHTEAEVDPAEIFAHVYATQRSSLTEQRDLLLAELAEADTEDEGTES